MLKVAFGEMGENSNRNYKCPAQQQPLKLTTTIGSGSRKRMQNAQGQCKREIAQASSALLR